MEMSNLNDCIENLELQIRWIEEIDAHKFSGWKHTVDAMRQAVVLLKAQEPHVMTLEEVRKWEQPDVWMEFRKDGTIEPTARFGFAAIAAVVTNSTVKPPLTMADAYGITWRCWTSRPSDELREAVKWE